MRMFLKLRRLPLPDGFLPGRIYVVKGTSMEPSFKDGTWLLVSRRAYLDRGDVAVICDPRDRGRSFVKRTCLREVIP